MSGPIVPWIPLIVAALLVPLWLLAALFFTLLGRNDSRPAPAGFWRTYVGWLWLELPPMVLLWAYFGTPLRQLGFLPLVLGMALVYGVVTGLGEKLPLIGGWIAALRQREAGRADKGIL
jgi:hypothetical protein